MSPPPKPKLALDDLLDRLNQISNGDEQLSDFDIMRLKREATKLSESTTPVISINGFMYLGMLAVICSKYESAKAYFKTARNHAKYKLQEYVEDVERNYIRSLYKLGRYSEAYDEISKLNFEYKHTHEISSFISSGYFSGHYTQTLKWLKIGLGKDFSGFEDLIPMWNNMYKACEHLKNNVESESGLVAYYKLIESFMIENNLKMNAFDVLIDGNELWMDIDLDGSSDTWETERNLFSFLSTQEITPDASTSVYWGIKQK